MKNSAFFLIAILFILLGTSGCVTDPNSIFYGSGAPDSTTTQENTMTPPTLPQKPPAC